jgi:hypothetical protein
MKSMFFSYLVESRFRLMVGMLFFALIAGCNAGSSVDVPTNRQSYDDLTSFFREWRAFRAPARVNGVPDFSVATMKKQFDELTEWQKALAEFPKDSWPIASQVDWHLIRAEMNGLEFDHRVLRPWERDPAYYVYFYPSPTDVPNREGPMIEGSIEASYYSYPLSTEDAEIFRQGLDLIPALYREARTNLTGNARDLWVNGAKSIREQSSDLEAFANRVSTIHSDLAALALRAKASSDSLASWLDEQAASKTGPSGVGKENLTWALKNIHYVNLTWEEEVLLVKRELARAHAALRLEENRNRRLADLEKFDNAETFDLELNRAVDEYMEFLKEEEILPMKDYMDQALRERIGRFTPNDGIRGFFDEVGYRDAMPMRTHGNHWFDLARMREEPHASPIRRSPLWYNIFDGRAEGMATGMEEMMMHAGLFDNRPQARELVWILLAQRAARALGGLYQQGNVMNHDEATKFADKWTPRGYLPWDGSTIQHEQHFYARQPTYGESYVIGKIEVEKLIAEYARQREDTFTLYQFMDDFNGVGMIPVSLINWELNGDATEIDEMVASN